jgi:hypothetical protein
VGRGWVVGLWSGARTRRRVLVGRSFLFGFFLMRCVQRMREDGWLLIAG